MPRAARPLLLVTVLLLISAVALAVTRTGGDEDGEVAVSGPATDEPATEDPVDEPAGGEPATDEPADDDGVTTSQSDGVVDEDDDGADAGSLDADGAADTTPDPDTLDADPDTLDADPDTLDADPDRGPLPNTGAGAGAVSLVAMAAAAALHRRDA